MLFYNSLSLGELSQQSSVVITIEANGGECELNSLHLNQLRHQIAEGKHSVIVIAHLGDGEHSRMLNGRRLHNARTLLSFKNVITAEGERVKGNGRVRFYVNGNLHLESLIKRGKDLCVTCCDPEKDFYPWYKPQNEKRKRQ